MSPQLDLARYLLIPGRDLLVIVGKANIRSDSVARIFSILESQKIKILRIYASASDEEGFADLVVFMDVTDATIPSESVGRVSESLGLIKVEKVVMSPIKGFIADTASYPVVADSFRAVIFRKPGYRELLEGIREYFGKSGDSFLYHIGYRTGLAYGKNHRKFAESLKIQDPALIYKDISSTLFQWAGFGRMNVQELDQERGTIIVYDSFECELGKGRSIPYSQFVRGLLAGVLSELFGKGFNVMEEACIAKGDPSCKFVVKAMPRRSRPNLNYQKYTNA
ncbi:MAG: hypothetical protein N3D12_05420 [Candidatus Methanomethyliaceae archaeon]|nr:hypothetical protein [Candidatus Methanomethyliaceae archaeon]